MFGFIRTFGDSFQRGRLGVDILLGDLKEAYVLRQAGGFAIKRLTELFALTDETGYVLYARAGGYNVDAETHPVRSLVMHV